MKKVIMNICACHWYKDKVFAASGKKTLTAVDTELAEAPSAVVRLKPGK